MKRIELIEKMASIVTSYMDAYKTDFYDYDLPRLKSIEQDYDLWQGEWMLRDTGTDFIGLDSEYIDSFRHHNEIRYLIEYRDEKWNITLIEGEA